MQSPSPDPLPSEYDVLSAKSLLSRIVGAFKGSFGVPAQKLNYESLSDDETEEETMGVSYTGHLLDLLVAAPQPLVTKVDSVMARLQARIKQSLQCDRHILSRRASMKTVCLRCGHVAPVTCHESVLEPRDPELRPEACYTCDACEGRPECRHQDQEHHHRHQDHQDRQHHQAAPVHGEEEIYPRNS